jgi:hypothetical protein
MRLYRCMLFIISICKTASSYEVINVTPACQARAPRFEIIKNILYVIIILNSKKKKTFYL